jgi:hypothetical protein
VPGDDLLDLRTFLTISVWWVIWRAHDLVEKLIGTAFNGLLSRKSTQEPLLPDDGRRNLAFELFLSSRAPKTEVICPTDWSHKPPDVRLPNGKLTYGHEYAILQSIANFYDQAPIAWDSKNESWLAHAHSSQIILASGSSNLASAEIIGTPTNPRFSTRLGDFQVNLTYAIKLADGRLKRLQYGEEIERRRHAICDKNKKVIVQADGAGGYQTDDYLLVTRLPGAAPDTVLTVLSGLHGPGTRSAEMLFQTVSTMDLGELATTIDHQSGNVPYFQAVFRASRFIELNGSSVPTEIELVTRGCPPIRLEI